MNSPEHLLARLDAIAASLRTRPSALALLGLGSVGTDLHRLDCYSDLDFFTVVKRGAKQEYIENLDWLSDVHPVAWSFQNTPDGHKLLFADGIFCEFAVFDADEISDAQHPGGRLIWHRPEFDPALCEPRHPPPAPTPHSAEWLVGEALSNLCVGLCRLLRGEVWSATVFVQGYAVSRVADLIALESEDSGDRDPYSQERRFEDRFPAARRVFPQCMGGYEHVPESALAILEFIEQRHPVNPAMKAEILRLVEMARTSE